MLRSLLLRSCVPASRASLSLERGHGSVGLNPHYWLSDGQKRRRWTEWTAALRVWSIFNVIRPANIFMFHLSAAVALMIQALSCFLEWKGMFSMPDVEKTVLKFHILKAEKALFKNLSSLAVFPFTSLAWIWCVSASSSLEVVILDRCPRWSHFNLSNTIWAHAWCCGSRRFCVCSQNVSFPPQTFLKQYVLLPARGLENLENNSVSKLS